MVASYFLLVLPVSLELSSGLSMRDDLKAYLVLQNLEPILVNKMRGLTSRFSHGSPQRGQIEHFRLCYTSCVGISASASYLMKEAVNISLSDIDD
jgi:hypothetical protein